MENETQTKPSRQVCVAESSKYRKHWYFEDDVLVEEHFFKIENGLEVPCKEPEGERQILKLPSDFTSAEKLQIMNPYTGEITKELLKGPRPKEKEGTVIYKIYNKTKNIGELHKTVDGADVETRFFKVENNHEIFIPRPNNDERKFTAEAPADIDHFEQLQFLNAETNQITRTIPRTHVLHIDDTEIEFENADTRSVKDILGKIDALSKEEKEKLKQALAKPNPLTTLDGRKKSQAEYAEVKDAIETIITLPQEVQEKLYKTIDSSQEFGISRFVADRIYHLPTLLKEPSLKRQEGTNTYIVRAEERDSKGNKIMLEHRFPSKSEEMAEKTAELVIHRLQTVQHRILLAAWQLANQLEQLTYTCELTVLMQHCYPERNSYFSTKEKVQFYEDLRSLENTKLVFSQKIKKRGAAKTVIEDYEIRLLEIEKKRGTQEKYPSHITLTILNTKALQNQKMAFVSAAFKHKTLELHSDDTLLAQVIQTRKSQCMGKKFLRFDREYLIKLSGLMKTNESKKAVANKKLLEKFKRLEDKGVIVKAPVKIHEKVSIRIRE